MRFMMLMIPGVYQGVAGANVGADFTPSTEMVEKMTRYNEDLAKSGTLISLDGLQPPSKGAHVRFSGGKPRVVDGPVPELKGVVGGYWMIQVNSKAEAVDWARRCPAQDGDVIEIRQVFEMSDLPEDTRQAAESSVVEAQIEKHKNR